MEIFQEKIDKEKIFITIGKKKCGFVPYSFCSCGVLRFFFYVYDVIQVFLTILVKPYDHPALYR